MTKITTPQPTPPAATVATLPQADLTAPANAFGWTASLEINYRPQLRGDHLSPSEAEILLNALSQQRERSIKELEQLFTFILEESSDDTVGLSGLLERDCRDVLQVIACCAENADVIALHGLSQLRLVAAQYPHLIDKSQDHD